MIIDWFVRRVAPSRPFMFTQVEKWVKEIAIELSNRGLTEMADLNRSSLSSSSVEVLTSGDELNISSIVFIQGRENNLKKSN